MPDNSNLSPATFKQQMVFVYTSSGTFIDVLRDAPLLAGFKEAINAATAPLQITLPRTFDNFNASPFSTPSIIAQGNIVKYYLFGPGLPAAGLLRFQGIIDAYAPQILDTGEENITVTIVPQSSVFADHGMVGSITLGTIGGSGIDAVRHFNYWFNTTDSITGHPYTYPLTLSSSNPSSSGNITSYTYQNENLASIFTTVLQMLPANWFYRANVDNTVTLNVAASSPQHIFYIGQHISSLNYSQDWSQLKNVVYLTGASTYNSTTQTYTTITATKVGSDISTFGERITYYNDSRITDQGTANTIAQDVLSQLDLVQSNITVRVLDYRGANPNVGYDIESIQVGDTCQIIDLSTPISTSTATWNYSKWDGTGVYWDYSPGTPFTANVLIASLTYGFDYVDLELSTLQASQDRALNAIRNQFQDFTMAQPTVV